MKKLVAILLTAVMLLSACALGEGAQIVLRDIVGSTNGQVAMDLTGLDIVLSIAGDGNQGGVHLGFDVNGEQMSGVLLALVGQQILLDIDAGDGQQRSYYVDLNALLGLLGQQIDLATILESAGEAVTGDDSVAEQFGEQFAEIFLGGVTEGGTTTLDGKEYDVYQIEIPSDKMRATIDAFADALLQRGNVGQAQVEAMQEALFSNGQEYSVSGAVYSAEDSKIVDLTLSMISSDMSEPATVRVYCEAVENVSGGMQFNIELSAAADGEEYALSLTLNALALNDVSWLPSDVGGAVDILSVEDLEEALSGDAMALVQGVMMSVFTAMSMNQQTAA